MAKSGMSESDVETDDEESPSNKQLNDNDSNASICIVTKPVKITTPLSILVESLVKNLCGVYEPDEKKAHKLYRLICEKLFEMKLIDESYGMVEFEGMRNQYERAFYHLVTAARGGKQPQPIHPAWPNTDITNDWSHYYREFEEIEFIAGGGFGQVFRVKHKLDDTEYAIKKIFIRAEGIESVRSYLTEVKTFASLNHSNIVQYKAAWLELGAAISKNAITDQSTETEYSYQSENVEEEISETKNVSNYIYPQSISEVEMTVYVNKVEESSDFEVTFMSGSCNEYNHKSTKKLKRQKRSSMSEGGNAICTFEEIEKIRAQSRPPRPKWATLFIQMALCQSTLKRWLEKRNSEDNKSTALVLSIKNTIRNETITEILKQLLRGLEYIHSKQIVHHDIKPSNIFVQTENGALLVQLGDFGLACPLQSARHSLAFGTKLYAAPEQLAGKCNAKSDMFSLGIILLELVEKFRTDMERVHSITELRKGNVSSHLLVQVPQFAQIISQLVVKSPTERPDATTLLKCLTVEVVESETIKDLKNKLAEKEEEITRLKQLLKTAGIQNC